MSWSDDTRCLYCEGRLPLYRKITHGQFCSSAHRKAYWQEQERLAVERLQQTHSSLRSYRSVSHPDVPIEVPQEVAPYPQMERVTQVRVATQLALEAAPELEPAPTFDVSLYPIPDVSEHPLAAGEFLSLLAPEFLAVGGSSPALVAADPFEYEITRLPLPPSSVWRGPETNPLPEGSPISVWSYLPSLQAPASQCARGERGTQQESEVPLCHPRSLEPAVGIRTAGRVGWPPAPALEARRAMGPVGSSFQVLAMESAPVTSIELKVAVQSDVLLQLLDQQVPHPARLHALGQFAAHQCVFAMACPPPQQFDAIPDTALPAVAVPAAVADYQLLSGTEMLRLSTALNPAQGSFANRMAVSEITGNRPATVAAAMPMVEPVRQLVTPGLQSLGLNLVRPAQGLFALPTPDSMAMDLSAGVCSDIAFPNLAASESTSMALAFNRLLPLTFSKKRKAAGAVSSLDAVSRVFPQAVESHPVLPHSGLEPLDRKPPEDALRTPETVLGSLLRRGEGLMKLEPAWAQATGFWHHAPRDLKLLLFAIPALLALFFHPGLPRIAFAAQPSSGFSGSFKRVLNEGWENVHQTLENRAGVALDEDFRSGLDSWASPGGSTTEWSFDATGFVRPGPLALYRPSVSLRDYQVQFLGLVDKKALSWVVRAADFENFYVVKLAVAKPGPMSALSLTRYAVINGKAQDRHDVNIPLTVGPDTLYRVRMDVRGSDFTVEVQDQIADSWTETRLPQGGIGFFTASGEASRLRWVQITHQYDMLGRLCAYLAPYDTTNGSWQP